MTPLQMPKALILDLDGTFVDTAPDLINSLNKVISNEGLPKLPFEIARACIGHGARHMISRGFQECNKNLSKQKLDDLFEKFLSHYEANIANESKIFPGALASLKKFQEHGWVFAICTNKLEHLARKLLNELNVSDYFKVVTGADTYNFGKPNPLPIQKTMTKMGAIPENTIMVGDSGPDIEGAKNAGIPSIAVDFGYTPIPVSHFKPDKVISHFDDLWSAIQKVKA